ncbi:MAG: hypothetical protein U5N10_10715 [Gemmobacter sp.]|nr:hypothetical protein [Gemmobacter sp.]
MINRAEMLTAIGEMRGRLDELERMIRLAPGGAVSAPGGFEAPGIEVLTPPAFQAFRAAPPAAEPVALLPQCPFADSVQFNATNKTSAASLQPFALSQLHRNGAEPVTGLRLVPPLVDDGWFTYEFLAGDLDLLEWEWTEWILKVALDEPLAMYAAFLVASDGKDGKLDRIPLERKRITEHPSFIHCRLDRKKILATLDGASPKSARLRLSTGGPRVPLMIYAFNIYGKR